MNVKFIDTSVMLNLLEVPGRCADVKEIQEQLKKSLAEEEAPWQFYGVSMSKEELLYLAGHIEEFAIREMGIGDVSIVYAYERYINEMPAIGNIMIWSTDIHLKGYHAENVSISRRRKK